MELLNLFKRHLATSNTTSSKSTVKNYVSDIRHFLGWFEQLRHREVTIDEITPDVIKLYEKSMGGKIKNGSIEPGSQLSVASMKRHLSSLRKFFTFLEDEKLNISNPFREIVPETTEIPTDYWHLQSFKDYLIQTKASKLTIKNYLSDIQSFAKWYEEAILPTLDKPLTSTGGFYLITQSVLSDYRERLLQIQKAAPRTINRKLSSLRRYLEFAAKKGFINNHELTLDPVALYEQETVQRDEPQISLNEISVSEKGGPTYSKFPPLRLTQKLFIFPYLSVEEKAANIIAGIITGTPVSGVYDIPKKVKQQLTDKTLLRSQSQTVSSLLNVNNVAKEFYAPQKVSLLGMPLHKKALHHVRHSRPAWYKKYHNYQFVHYAHFALLVIFASGVGVALYQNLIAKRESSFAAPTAPPRVLSFQGRLTDNLDNPITTPTNIRFAIYNDSTASGSALLWQEVIGSIAPDQDGIFSVILGEGTTIPSTVFTDNANIYLGVTIFSTSELAPRQRIASVGYATNAEFLQGLPPSTQAGITSFSNVILALDSSGNLILSDTAPTDHTFQVNNGTFNLSGQNLYLTTNSGSDGSVILDPNGFGKIDVRKGLVNSTDNGSILPGGVEVHDRFGVLATESAVAAFIVNNDAGGDIFTASSSGTTRFSIASDGNLTAPFYNGQNAVLYGMESTGLIAQLTTPTSGLCLQSGSSTPTWATCGGANYWNLTGGSIKPINDTVDLLVGGQTTASAKFRFINNLTGTPVASVSANSGNNATFLAGDGTLGTTNRQTLTIGNSSTYNTTGNILINPNGIGRIGIGTTSPLLGFDLRGNSGTQAAASISAQTSAATLIVDNRGVGDLFAASASGVPNFIVRNNGDIVVGQNGEGKITAAVLDPYLIQNQKTSGIQSLSYQTMGASGADHIFLNQSTELGRLTMAGQLRLPITGSTGGILIGGDTHIYRGNTNRLDLSTGDSFNIVNGSLQIGGTTVIDASRNGIFNTLTVSGGCTGCISSNVTPFQVLSGAIAPLNSTLDFLIGGQSTQSANFAVLNMNGGTPTASVAGNLIVQADNGNGGFVGIGTNNPSVPLHVARIATADPIAQFSSANAASVYISGSTGSQKLFVSNGNDNFLTGTSAGDSGIVFNLGTDYFIGEDTQGARLMIEATTGYVGIGTTSPTEKLEVDGNIRITDDGDNALILGRSDNIQEGGQINWTGSASYDSWFQDIYQNTMRIFSNSSNTDQVQIMNVGSATTGLYVEGLTGLGTTTPTSQLYVTRPLSTGVTGQALAIFDQIESQDILSASASGTTRFVIQNSGRVGIGTALPSTSLDVEGGSIQIDTATTLTSPDRWIGRGGNFGLSFDSTQGTLLTSPANLLFQVDSDNSDADVRKIIFAKNGDQYSSGETAEGTHLFVINESGTLEAPIYNINGGLLYTNGSGLLGQTGAGSLGECLISAGGGSPTWGSCVGSGGTNWNISNGVITPKLTSTLDFLLGSNSTSSAKFAVLNINNGTPTASVSSTLTGNGIAIGGDGRIQSVRNNTLLLGGNTTGNIVLSPLNGAGGVGIGTGSPRATLDVSGTGNIAIFGLNSLTDEYIAIRDTANGVFFGLDASLNGGSGAGLIQGGANKALAFQANDAVFGNASTPDMYINTDGTVGINTVTPTAQLDVNGSASVSGSLKLYGTPTIQSTANQTLTLGGSTTGNITLSPLNGSGFVGINTAVPGAALDVNGSIRLAGGGTIDTRTGNTLGIGTTNATTISIGRTGQGITLPGFTTNGGLFYANGSGVLAQTGAGASNQCLLGGTTPTWGACSTGTTTSPFQQGAGFIFPNNATSDFLIGGQATNSAKFAVLNVNGTGPATATVSGNLIVMPNNGAGGRLGIGTINPNNKIQVADLINFNDALQSTFLGQGAGAVSSGTSNTAVGYQALFSNTTGLVNSAFGNAALSNNTTGNYNNAFGNGALLQSSSGYENNAFGNDALGLNSTGNSNSAFGNAALFGNSTGNSNSAFGNRALMYNNRGTNNTALGTNTGSTNTVGGLNTFLGSYSDAQAQHLINATAIGARSYVGQNNSLVLGSIGGVNSATGSAQIGIGITTPTSALHLTRPININSPALGKALAIFDQIENQDIFTASSAGTTRFVIANDGKVGVGKASPAYDVDVNSSNISTTLALTASGSWPARLTQDSSSLFTINNGNLDRFAIDSTGKTGIGTTSPTSQLHITRPLTFGATGKALGIFDQIENQDIFTASASGTTRFTIGNNGTITASAYNTNGGLLFTNGSGVLAQTGAGTGSQCLLGGTTPTWGSCSTGGTDSPFQVLNKTIVQNNTTLDFLLGDTATNSAKFAVINLAGGTPTASISAGSGNNRTFLSGSGNLGTTNGQTLTLGGASTGDIILTPNTTTEIVKDLNRTALTGTSKGLLHLNGGTDFGASEVTAITLGEASSQVDRPLSIIGVQNTINGSNLFFGTSNNYGSGITNTAMLIDYNGNVGIGTTTPLAKLDVGGNASVSGNLTLAGSSRSLQSTSSETLTIGGSTTGWVTLAPNNSAATGRVNVTGRLAVATGGTDSTLDASFEGLQSLGSGDLSMTARGDVRFNIDTNSNGTNLFRFLTGSSTQVATIDESGNLSLAASASIDTLTNGTLSIGNTSATTVTIGRTGQNISLPRYTTPGGIFYANGAGTLIQTGAGTGSQCLLGGSTPSWGSCGSSEGSNWTISSANGTIRPNNSTLDLLIGGTTTASAKFAVLNVAGGTPTASVSAGTSGATYITAGGNLQTTANQTLTLGGNTTGNIFMPLLNTKGLTLTSDLSGGSRSTDVLTITQPNNGSNNSTGNLLQLTNSDTGSVTPLAIHQAAAGAAVTITGGTGYSGISIDTFLGSFGKGINIGTVGSDGTGIDIANISGGTGLNLYNVINSVFNSGVLNEGGTGIKYTPTNDYSGTGTNNISQKFIDAVRTYSAQSGATVNLTGDMVSLTSTCSGAGTCTDNSNLISLTQNYGKATGAVLEITNVGNGNGLLINSNSAGQASAVINNTGAGAIFTASASGTTRFTISNSGAVGIGTGTPLDDLHIQSNDASIYLSNVGESISTKLFLAPGNNNFIPGTLTGDSGIDFHGVTGGFVIGSSSGVKFKVANDGNVGIGTYLSPTGVTPRAQLHVFDNSLNQPAASISASNTSGPALLVTQDGTGDILVASASGLRKFWVTADGDVNYTGDLNAVLGDFAEYFKKADVNENFEAGQLVCASDIGVTKCTPSAPNIIGAVSDNAMIKGGGFHENDPEYVLVGLVGQLGVRVTGDVKKGDALTLSSIPGVAVKATKESEVIGFALKDKSAGSSRVDTVIQPKYYNPHLDLQNEETVDALALVFNNGVFSLIKPGGSDIFRVDAFSKAVIANLRAGAIQAQSLTSQTVNATTAFVGTLSGNTLSFAQGSFQALTATVSNLGNATASTLAIATDSITISGQNIRDFIIETVQNAGFTNQPVSPLATYEVKTNVVSPLGDEATTELRLNNDNIEIRNSQTGQTAAWFDNNGNASISGELVSQGIAAIDATFSGTLASNTLTTNEASVSGTLRADTIVANSIEGLENKISSIAGNLIATTQSTNINTQNITAQFGIFEHGITAMGPITAPILTATDQLAVGGNFTISDNAINTIGADLEIQSFRQGNIAFQGGLIKMDTDGNMEIAGNLNVMGEIDAVFGVFSGTLTTKALATSLISPLPGDDLTIQLTDDIASNSSKLRIANAQDQEVLSINNKGDIVSSGAATLAKLNFNLVGQAQATSLSEAVATGSAGFATLRAGQPEITIINPHITSKSLIYITPFGDTGNKVLYLQRQTPATEVEDGSFTVGISGQTSQQNIQFNWLIVN